MGRPFLFTIVLMLAGCAGASRGPGVVAIGDPEPVHGDDTAIAWPFVVTHEGNAEIVADFHLRIEEGGTLVAVRPDPQNPDTEATVRWRGEIRGGEGYWIGDVLPKGGEVRLWALVRPAASASGPRIRVVHWPTNGRDHPVGEEKCEIWGYDTGSQRVRQESC